MSFALAVLRRLLQQDETLIGVVVSVDGAQMRIATAKGAMTVTASGSTAVGDRVLIRSGIAFAAPFATRSYPV